jgi:signal transduction histidine kinase
MNELVGGSGRAAYDGPRSRKPEDATSRPERFARSVLDGLSAHVAVLDEAGTIVAANGAWKAFAQANGGDPRRVSEGADYLGACEAATGPNAEGAAEFAAGIREVLAGRKERFELEYPCHSPTQRRWFLGRVSRLPEAGPSRAVVAHEDITDRRRREEERARRRLEQAAARAKTQEQKQIGRELHDRVAHTMVLIHHSLQLHEVYEERGEPQKAAEKLELAKRMAAEAIDQTRDLSRALSSGEVAQGLEARLSELFSGLAMQGMTHELSVEGDEEEEVPAEVREQLFLVLREAVRNAVTHSGASKLRVQVRTDRERIAGVVEDDGRGFERKPRERPEAGGLSHMAERAWLMGGTCSIESAPGEGTRVEASFPFDGA